MESRPRLVQLIHDVFWHPFRPHVFDTRWRSPVVLEQAQYCYDNRNFDNLPLLATALEEAGCDDQEIIQHCRSNRPHVKGCWVVDRILGKEAFD
ncbi:hypothetical protein KIH39_21590 [Telmatocola sphagniphila]|uniref:SMI1/KNR4 family protein n=1 Tax=Telmatocola sphagniphila TaxID=1123043 RepID=A0A8E6BAY4_9BACT|nr:hypothetical protein KIH39_21590 [Telmatocola sphagniphila]